jgi:predicted DNA-binding transcriptional regulator AlpA
MHRSEAHLMLHDPYLDLDRDLYLNQIITKPELAAERRVSVDTIDRMVKRGLLPPPLRLSPQRFGWRRRDVQPKNSSDSA